MKLVHQIQNLYEAIQLDGISIQCSTTFKCVMITALVGITEGIHFVHGYPTDDFFIFAELRASVAPAKIGVVRRPN